MKKILLILIAAFVLQLFVYGEGVEQDLEKGRYWIEKSVEQGNSNAQCIL